MLRTLTPSGRTAATTAAVVLVNIYPLGRALVISLNDNAYHYRTPLDDVRYGRDLDAGPIAKRLPLNFNLHGAHHLNPRLRWSELSAASSVSRRGRWLHALLSQLAGPVAESELRVRADARSSAA